MDGNSGGNGNPLASFGPDKYVVNAGTFQNGGVYQAARTNQTPFTGSDGSGTFYFGYPWNYFGQTANGSSYDMTTVAIHEMTHGLGFLSLTNPNGSGLDGGLPGSPGLYAVYDKYLLRGNSPGTPLFNTNISSSGYGSFIGQSSTFTNGNSTSTGLFFGGQYTLEVRGGAAPLYAPSTYQSGSSVSHVNDSTAVMNPSVTPNTVKRFQRYEIAMLMDIGWNVYNWNNTTGNFGDGTSNVAQSRWLSDQGIVADASFNEYNTFANPQQAPVLPVYGQVTSNIILNFGGSGASQYTTTNNLGNIRVARLNLNSSSTQSNTIAGGTFQFGVNSDNTASVLAPKIVQQNSGAFAIGSNLVITNTTAAPGGGWSGLTVDGTGSGKVTLSGVISGTGTLTKAGTFTLELAGSSANTYTGTTTVSAGILLANKTAGQDAIAGDLIISSLGTVRLGAANQLQGDGTGKTLTLAGGTLSTGSGIGFDDTLGALKTTANSTIALGTGSHILRFTGLSGTPTGTLTITGWTGIGGTSGAEGDLLFAGIGTNPNIDHANFLATIQFQNYAAGARFISSGELGVYELVPVPEPATILAVAFGALGMGALVRRRREKSSERGHQLSA